MKKSVYMITPELVDWLSHTMVPMEQGAYEHYRGMQHLVRIVDSAESGQTSRYAAFDAIREYNRAHGTCVTYEEVATKSSAYVFSDFGAWVAYFQRPEDVSAVLCSPFRDAQDALDNAPDSVEYVLVLLPNDDCVVVYRSPYVEGRRSYEDSDDLSEGISSGSAESFVLPPEIEASLGTVDPEALFAEAGYTDESRIRAYAY